MDTSTATSSPDAAVSLSWVVNSVRDWVERCSSIWVEAQIIELKRRSGYQQFLTLHDVTEEVSATATCPRHVLDAAGPVEAGMTVFALIHPTVWRKSGRLSFVIAEIRPTGQGQLLAQLEKRRRQLEAEGLFRPELRKPLPLLPQGVGLITGADSDAQKDVIRNARLRWPAVRFVIRNTLVQGPHAVRQIVTALADLDADPSVDVIVLARGGGSLEDLLAFSDESLVRAVHAATTPVVSAIGHEADTPIVDLVADLRASTPTDAGKRIVPDAAQERDGVSQALARIRQLIDSQLRAEETTLSNLMSRPVMRNPAASLALEAERIETMHRLLRVQVDRHLTGRSQELDHLIAQVRSLSPKATLDRGYAVLTSPSGEVRTSVSDVHPADAMFVRLADGELDVTVNALRPTPSSTSPTTAPDKEQS